MKKILILAATLFVTSCGNSAKPIASNAPAASGTPERSETAIAHGPKEEVPGGNSNTGPKSKWSQGGEPMDTTTFDAEISKTEKDLSSKPSDAGLKKALSEAYYKRAVALTDKRQYAAALGDYRRAYKYDPSNTEAKDWIDKIIMIYDSMNKSYPPEGEEPGPLPFKKG